MTSHLERRLRVFLIGCAIVIAFALATWGIQYLGMLG
jgi:hypothetical protein